MGKVIGEFADDINLFLFINEGIRRAVVRVPRDSAEKKPIHLAAFVIFRPLFGDRYFQAFSDCRAASGHETFLHSAKIHHCVGGIRDAFPNLVFRIILHEDQKLKEKGEEMNGAKGHIEK